MMRPTIRVPADQIRVIFVYHFCGHPISGVCAVNGKTYSFERDDGSGWTTLTRLNRRQRLSHWSRRTLFGICVGWHQHYVNGKKARIYQARKPRFLYQMLFALYYGKARLWRPGTPSRRTPR